MKKRRKLLAKRLEDDLLSGKWDKKYGKHRTLPGFIGAKYENRLKSLMLLTSMREITYSLSFAVVSTFMLMFLDRPHL